MKLMQRGEWLYTSHIHTDAPSGKCAVECTGISFAYGRGQLALENVSLHLASGEHAVVLGPNGAGKSTLLKLIGGLLRPQPTGQIHVFGNAVDACHPHTAYLAQRNEVNWRVPLTVRDVVMQGRFPHIGWLARPGREDHDAVDAALESVRLSNLRDRAISELSGGQQQRAFIARAIAQNAQLLLLDEPFTGLDAEAQRTLIALLRELRDQGRAMLLSTHDLGPVIAGQVAQRAILLDKRVLADGTTQQVTQPEVLARAYA